MQQWTFKLKPLSRADIKRHCVENFGWQSFRKTLKGLPTAEKLDKLASWMYASRNDPAGYKRAEIQTTNYLCALKRGGFLNERLQVVR